MSLPPRFDDRWGFCCCFLSFFRCVGVRPSLCFSSGHRNPLFLGSTYWKWRVISLSIYTYNALMSIPPSFGNRWWFCCVLFFFLSNGVILFALVVASFWRFLFYIDFFAVAALLSLVEPSAKSSPFLLSPVALFAAAMQFWNRQLLWTLGHVWLFVWSARLQYLLVRLQKCQWPITCFVLTDCSSVSSPIEPGLFDCF